MVEDLLMDVEIIVAPTVRDDDGVALSSRNHRLSAAQRLAARAIPRALEAAQHVVTEGQRKPEEVVEAAREVIDAESELKVDYLELVDPGTLEPLSLLEKEALLLVAVFAGPIRLLDNQLLEI